MTQIDSPVFSGWASGALMYRNYNNTLLQVDAFGVLQNAGVLFDTDQNYLIGPGAEPRITGFSNGAWNLNKVHYQDEFLTPGDLGPPGREWQVTKTGNGGYAWVNQTKLALQTGALPGSGCKLAQRNTGDATDGRGCLFYIWLELPEQGVGATVRFGYEAESNPEVFVRLRMPEASVPWAWYAEVSDGTQARGAYTGVNASADRRLFLIDLRERGIARFSATGQWGLFTPTPQCTLTTALPPAGTSLRPFVEITTQTSGPERRVWVDSVYLVRNR